MTVFTAPLILGQGIEAVGELGIRSPDTGLQLGGTRFQIHDGFIRLDARNPKVTADVPLS